MIIPLRYVKTFIIIQPFACFLFTKYAVNGNSCSCPSVIRFIRWNALKFVENHYNRNEKWRIQTMRSNNKIQMNLDCRILLIINRSKIPNSQASKIISVDINFVLCIWNFLLTVF